MGLMVPHFKQKLLWTNKDSGSWSGRKISMDLTQYDAVIIVAKLQSSYSQGQSAICFKGILTNIVVYDYDAAIASSIRRAFVEDDGVTFSEAKNYGGAIDNKKCWPYLIYGIKI